MSVKNVVIGWSEQKNLDAIKARLFPVFLSIEHLTDEHHLFVLTNKEDIDNAVSSGKVDVLLIAEEINGTPIGKGTIRQYLNAKDDIRVILIVNGQRLSSGKMKGLYDYGYYDALFERDFTKNNLKNLLLDSRTAPDAYDYYGLADFKDPLDSKDDVEPQKKEIIDNGIPKTVRKNDSVVESDNDFSDVLGGDDSVKFFELLDDEHDRSGDTVFEKETMSNDRQGKKNSQSKKTTDNAGSKQSKKGQKTFKEETNAKSRTSPKKNEKDGEKEKGDGRRSTAKGAVKGSTKDSVKSSVKGSVKIVGKSPKSLSKGLEPSRPSDKSSAKSSPKPSAKRKNGKPDKKDIRLEEELDMPTDIADDLDAVEASKEVYNESYDEPADAGDIDGAEDTEDTEYAKGSDDVDDTGDAEDTEDYDEAEDDTDDIEDAKEEPYDEAVDGGSDDTNDDTNNAPDNTAGSSDEQLPVPGVGNSRFFKMSPREIERFLEKEDATLKVPRLKEYKRDRLHDEKEALLDHFIRQNPKEMLNLSKGITTKEDFSKYVIQVITSMHPKSDEDAKELYDDFMRFMFGYDVLTPLVNDPLVSDIKCYTYDNVRVKRRGERIESDVKFRSDNHYKAFVSHLAWQNNTPINFGEAIVHFSDTKSFKSVRLRLNISTEYVNTNNSPCVHIRKENTTKYTTEELIREKMFSPRTAAFLIDAAQNDGGLLFTGKGSAGKTTIMNWLIDYIPRDKSGICIQESDELFSDVHPDILFQRIAEIKQKQFTNDKQATMESYDLKSLSVNALLTDVDYFIIGEIKGAEARYFLNAAYTGNRCWASVHSPSSQDALEKIADYATYESAYTTSELLKMLTSIRTVVFLKDFRVKEISRVTGWDAERKQVKYERVPLD